MSEIYVAIVVILGVLAISGLFFGVTNDAVNFLNSAIGSKAAPMRTILTVASAGIIIGVVTSSGMMEVARNGMFNPSLFSFHEVMTLYLGVMFANIILLNLYKSLGLPTSTTVSLIFCLLGSAVAVSTYKIAASDALTVSDLSEFINTSRAMGIVSAILLSVVLAFSCGSFVMYISRMIFSFRYTAMFRRFGAFWCGISLTAIIYVAVFKGLKSALQGNPAMEFVNEHTMASLAVCWVVCSLVLFFLQRLKINILRITILSGSFALALSFAGNDLVNFIGVPVAGFDAFKIAQTTGSPSMTMEALNASVPAEFFLLLTAGAIMIVALWTQRKAMARLTEREMSLTSAQEDSGVQSDSSAFSRTLVRAALNINTALETVVPERIRTAVSRRFEYADVEHSGAPYDMIRAAVNLTTSAMLISMATSFKLPLSTTYVCFMVAMGTSLADRAWGRESAVYRITGVTTVIAGWFVTAFGGFIIAYLVGMVLIYGGTWAFAVTTVLCTYMLIRSNFKTSKEEPAEEHHADTSEDIMSSITTEVCTTMERTTRLYDRTLIAVFKENRKVLREMVKESEELFQLSRDRKYALLPTIRTLKGADLDTAQYYVQVVDYLNEMTKSLLHITRPAFEHIDNNHEGLSKEQTEDLMHINDEVESIYRQINMMLRTGNFDSIDSVLAMRDNLFEQIAEAIRSELERATSNRSNTKASMLYLNILSETKSMVLQSRNLLKAQRYFLENKGVLKSWLYYNN